MRNGYLALIALLLVLAAAAFLYSFLTIRPLGGSLDQISLPPGFRISVFADLGASGISLPGPNAGPRMMLVQGDRLLVTVPDQGRVVAFVDEGGTASNATTFMSGLNQPHGIDYADGWYYIAEEDKVIRVRAEGGGLVADTNSTQVLTDLPSGGQHVTRTVRVKDGFMYISIGSTCNVCHESDQRRAAILRCDLNGTDCSVYASGLRNSVGLAFQPGTGDLYATENGRDFLGDDIPPDEINIIREGGDYGWPICYGNNTHDTDFDKNVYIRNPCMEPFETPALIDLQAHSAPLGLAFYNGTSFPAEYRGKLFVAYHGSWNRQVPTGYKIVAVDVANGTVADFATGWLQGSAVLGRPVDVAVAQDGSLYVSDDAAGKIYRISYAG